MLLLFVCILLILLLISPKLSFALMVVLAVVVLTAGGGWGGKLVLEEKMLMMSTPFVDMVMLKDDLVSAKIRGNRLFGFELILKGNCRVLMKDGKSICRSSILIADIFPVSIHEVKSAVEEWKK